MRIFFNLKGLYYRVTQNGVAYARHVGVTVGDNCRIFIGKFGSEPWLISIGNKVTITSGTIILTHDGSTWLFNDQDGRRHLYRRVKIGNNVFIGSNSIIMPGVEIEDDVIVGAGSVVTKSVPRGAIIGGNPARIIRQFDEYKTFALENYVSNKDIDFSKSYRERVELVADTTFREFMQ